MQLLRRLPVTADQYFLNGYQLRISRPKNCPNCRLPKSLEALGYYARNLVGNIGKVRRIIIRRFRCRDCERTVSILPSFAQPYRLVQNPIVHRVFQGELFAEASRWLPLIRSYWLKFCRWLPDLRKQIGEITSRAPPRRNPQDWWNLLTTLMGSLGSITMKFVQEFGFTLFGRYQCHSPNP